MHFCAIRSLSSYEEFNIDSRFCTLGFDNNGYPKDHHL